MSGAGNLDRRITIERNHPTKDEFGGDVDNWVPFVQVWSKRQEVSDQERFSTGQVSASLRSRFKIRSSVMTRTITAKDRIDYDGAIWGIKGVKETKGGRNRFLEITAEREND